MRVLRSIKRRSREGIKRGKKTRLRKKGDIKKCAFINQRKTATKMLFTAPTASHRHCHVPQSSYRHRHGEIVIPISSYRHRHTDNVIQRNTDIVVSVIMASPYWLYWSSWSHQHKHILVRYWPHQNGHTGTAYTGQAGPTDNRHTGHIDIVILTILTIVIPATLTSIIYWSYTEIVTLAVNGIVVMKIILVVLASPYW